MSYLYVDRASREFVWFDDLANCLDGLPECREIHCQDAANGSEADSVVGSGVGSGFDSASGLLLLADPARPARLLLRDLHSGMEQSLDFAAPEFSQRLQVNNLSAEYVVRAVMGRRKSDTALTVLDTTGGFGRDAMLLAAAGCRVSSVERLPSLSLIVAAAVANITERMFDLEEPDPIDVLLSAAAQRLTCVADDSVKLLRQWREEVPDVVYIDPMYQEDAPSLRMVKKSGVKKYMVFLRRFNEIYQQHYQLAQCTGDSFYADEGAALLSAARAVARYKVVVKRAPKAPDLADLKPSSRLVGKAARFDVYAS